MIEPINTQTEKERQQHEWYCQKTKQYFNFRRNVRL